MPSAKTTNRKSPSRSSTRRPSSHRLGRVLAVGAVMLIADGMIDAEAKTPGAVYCLRDTCHRVISLEEMPRLVGRDKVLRASFYDHCRRDRFNPCGLTSSGERVRPGDADNAASPVFPDGTVLLLFHPANGRAALVRINNAGPYWGRRKLDVSRATARSLDFERAGVADLEVRVVLAPLPEEAVYRRHRRYDAVPGFIGTFASLAHAHAAVLADLERLVEARSPRPRTPSPEQPSVAAAIAAREAEAAAGRALVPLQLATRAPDVVETPSLRPFDLASLILPPLTLDRDPPRREPDVPGLDGHPPADRRATDDTVEPALAVPSAPPRIIADGAPSWWSGTIEPRRAVLASRCAFPRSRSRPRSPPSPS